MMVPWTVLAFTLALLPATFLAVSGQGNGRPTSVTCEQIRCQGGYICLDKTPPSCVEECRDSAVCVQRTQRARRSDDGERKCPKLDLDQCHVGCRVTEAENGCEICSCTNTGCPLMKCRAECGVKTGSDGCRVCGDKC